MKPHPAAKVSHDPPLPVVLPKAERPLTPAHVELLKMIAAHIVDTHVAELDSGEAS